MEPLVSVKSAQRVAAVLLFVIATAPVILFGLGAVFAYEPRGIFRPLIHIASYPGGGAQWFAYLALLISTWAGATLNAAFVVSVGDDAKITRFGVGFLVYVAATVTLGMAFVLFTGVPENLGPLTEMLPPSLIDPTGEDQPEVVDARAKEAIQAMSEYVHWAIGSQLTLAAAVLAIPAPTKPEGAQS